MTGQDVRQPVAGPSPRADIARTGLQFRAAILVGVGLTVGVWLFAGLSFGRRVTDLEGQVAAISQRYVGAQRLLTEARNQVLQSAIYLREALLAQSDPSLAESRGRMTTALDIAESRLAGYVPILDSEDERQRVAGLRQELGDLRRAMMDMLAIERRLWPTEAGALLRDKLMPRRESVVRVGGRAWDLESRGVCRVPGADAERLSGHPASGLAGARASHLAISLGVAALAIRGMSSRLERRVQPSGCATSKSRRTCTACRQR